MDKKELRRFQRMAKTFAADMALAETRVGNTPESRLKWLLDFKTQELNGLSSGEKAMLGFCLRTLPQSKLTHGGKVSFSSHWAMLGGPLMPDEVLFDLQGWVKELFHALTSEREPGFSVPPPKSMNLHRISSLASKKARFQWIRQFEYTDESLAIKYGIIDVLLLGSDKLRFCLECRAPFVAQRRQAYCKPACSQRARDKKRGKSYG